MKLTEEQKEVIIQELDAIKKAIENDSIIEERKPVILCSSMNENNVGLVIGDIKLIIYLIWNMINQNILVREIIKRMLLEKKLTYSKKDIERLFENKTKDIQS